MMQKLFAQTPLKSMDSAMLTASLVLEAGTASRRMLEAISFASLLHSGQTRANRANLPRTPYIEHPLRVALRLVRYRITDLDVLQAAILHDVVEDGIERFAEIMGLTFASEAEGRAAILDHIRTEFGERVARIVERVSNPIDLDFRKLSVEEKRRRYIQHLFDEVVEDAAALLIKIADFEDNALGLHHNLQVGKNEARVARMAMKYLEAIPVYQDALPVLEDSVIVPLASVHLIRQRLDLAGPRLSDLALAA